MSEKKFPIEDITNKIKDTLITPFYIIPNKVGSQYIGVIIDEMIFLNAYKYADSSVTRMLQNEHIYQKNIYVKNK